MTQSKQCVARTLLAAALMVGVGSTVTMSAQEQSGLINVTLTNVANNIARDLNIEVSQVPVTVQAPIGVAANVCGVDANVLAQQRKEGNTNCDAKTTSRALNQIVQRQIKK
jgi:hypothetical protein